MKLEIENYEQVLGTSKSYIYVCNLLLINIDLLIIKN